MHAGGEVAFLRSLEQDAEAPVSSLLVSGVQPCLSAPLVQAFRICGTPDTFVVARS